MADYPTREYIIRETTYPDATKQELIGELVRCKDCRWRDNQDGSTAWMPCRALVTPDDFYCSSGERKDGKGNGNETD